MGAITLPALHDRVKRQVEWPSAQYTARYVAAQGWQVTADELRRHVALALRLPLLAEEERERHPHLAAGTAVATTALIREGGEVRLVREAQVRRGILGPLVNWGAAPADVAGAAAEMMPDGIIFAGAFSPYRLGGGQDQIESWYPTAGIFIARRQDGDYAVLMW